MCACVSLKERQKHRLREQKCERESACVIACVREGEGERESSKLFSTHECGSARFFPPKVKYERYDISDRVHSISISAKDLRNRKFRFFAEKSWV